MLLVRLLGGFPIITVDKDRKEKATRNVIVKAYTMSGDVKTVYFGKHSRENIDETMRLAKERPTPWG